MEGMGDDIITEIGDGVEIGSTWFTSGDDPARELVYIQPANGSIIGLTRSQAHEVARALTVVADGLKLGLTEAQMALKRVRVLSLARADDEDFASLSAFLTNVGGEPDGRPSS